MWLCASHWHRSGDEDDAFPFFRSLHANGGVWPQDDDYEALAADRGERFVDFIMIEAPRLLQRARALPSTEHVLTIAREDVASIVVCLVETLEETFVAIAGGGPWMSPEHLLLLQVSLYPDHRFEDWRAEARLPTRELDPRRAEFCFSIVHERVVVSAARARPQES